MSMARCDGCERLIDTDNDPECFVTVLDRAPDESIARTRDRCLCSHCRDAGWYDIQEEA